MFFDLLAKYKYPTSFFNISKKSRLYKKGLNKDNDR